MSEKLSDELRINDYTIRVRISVERRTDQYRTDKMVDTDSSEVLTLTEAQVAHVLDAAVSDARRRAGDQLGVKYGVEARQRQIEAGTVEVNGGADDFSDLVGDESEA